MAKVPGMYYAGVRLARVRHDMLLARVALRAKALRRYIECDQSPELVPRHSSLPSPPEGTSPVYYIVSRWKRVLIRPSSALMVALAQAWQTGDGETHDH